MLVVFILVASCIVQEIQKLEHNVYWPQKCASRKTSIACTHQDGAMMTPLWDVYLSYVAYWKRLDFLRTLELIYENHSVLGLQMSWFDPEQCHACTQARAWLDIAVFEIELDSFGIEQALAYICNLLYTLINKARRDLELNISTLELSQCPVESIVWPNLGSFAALFSPWFNAIVDVLSY